MKQFKLLFFCVLAVIKIAAQPQDDSILIDSNHQILKRLQHNSMIDSEVDSVNKYEGSIYVFQTAEYDTNTHQMNTVYRGEFLIENQGPETQTALVVIEDKIDESFVGQYVPRKSDGKFIMILLEGKTYKVSYLLGNRVVWEDELIVPQGSNYKSNYKPIKLEPISAVMEENQEYDSSGMNELLNISELGSTTSKVVLNGSGKVFKYEQLGLMESYFVFK